MRTIQGSGPSTRTRPGTADDFPALISLVNAAFVIETFIDGTRTNDAHIRETAARGSFLVLEDQGGHVVGSVHVEARGERGYFGMLAVDPAHQGEGFGRTLVDAAEEHARQRGCTHMDITVLSLRPELLPFYRKLGYVETGIADFHPSHPLHAGVECHCITMSKVLG